MEYTKYSVRVQEKLQLEILPRYYKDMTYKFHIDSILVNPKHFESFQDVFS